MLSDTIPASSRRTAATPLCRALLILRMVARHPQGVTFTQLVNGASSIPRATLARQLRQLVEEGLVHKNLTTRLYTIGESCVDFARSVLGERPRGTVVRPVLEALARQTGESAAYFELDGDGVVLLAKVDMPDSWHFIHPYARNTRPDHGALVTILAHSPVSVADAFISAAGLRARHQRTALSNAISKARKSGRFNAAPVKTADDERVVGAILLSHLADRSRHAELRAAVRSAAMRAGELIGVHTRVLKPTR